MPNKAEWCTNNHCHLEHAGVIEGQVVVCDGLPPHPDVALIIQEAIDAHSENTDYDGLSYNPKRCYECGPIIGQSIEGHAAEVAARDVLAKLRPYLDFPLDDDEDFPL